MALLCIALQLCADTNIQFPLIPEITKGVSMDITKVVIPAAGYGSRFWPITKEIPKEMLQLLNKPALQVIVEEARLAGISESIVIVSENKTSIKQYFTEQPAFQSRVQKANKTNLTRELETILNSMAFTYINQPTMRGLGHAIMLAKEAIGSEYFGVMLPDDVSFEENTMKEIARIAKEEAATVIAVMEVPLKEISSYGSIKPGRQITDNLIEITDVIEKPKPHEAYSNLAITGRYAFSPAIFQALEATAPHASGEIQLTDAIALLARQGHKVLAYKVSGSRFDLGRPHGWLAANIYLGINDPEYGAWIREYIRKNI